MAGDLDPRAFGEALRERVERQTQAAFDAIMADFGASIRKAGEEAAAQAAQEHARAAVRKLGEDLGCDIARIATVLDMVRAQAASTETALKGLDLAESTSLYRSVREEQERLREARDRLTDDLAKARKAEGELRVLAGQLMATNASTEAVSAEMAGALAALQADLDQRAARAAAIVLKEIGDDARLSIDRAGKAERTEALAKLADAQSRADAARVAYEAMMEAARGEFAKAVVRLGAWEADAAARVEKAIAGLQARADRVEEELVRKADEAVLLTTTGSDATADETPLVPRAFRGPWKDGMKAQRGDLVSFYGSTFLATRPTSDKPYATMDEGAPWQLFAAGGFGGGFSNKRRTAELAAMVEELRNLVVGQQNHEMRLMVLEQFTPTITKVFNDGIYKPGIYAGNQ